MDNPNEVPIVSVKQLETLVQLAVLTAEPLLITGAPGIGKTAAPTALATKNEWPLMIQHPVVADPTDAKGFPVTIQNQETGKAEAVFLPYADLKEMMDYPTDTDKPLIVFLDDLGQAAPMVQAAYMQLLLAREINGKKISSMVRFIAATNRKEDRAGVKGILEPVKSRFAPIVELQPKLDEWVAWSLKAGVYPAIPAYIRFRPAALNDFRATAGMEQSACPRTWDKLSNLLNEMDRQNLKDSVLRNAIIQGTVGKARAVEYIAFERIWHSLPDLDELIKDPTNIIKNVDQSDPSVMYAIAMGAARRCTVKNIANIVKLASFIGQEYSSAMITDCLQICPEIDESDAFLDWSVDNAEIFL